MNINILDFQSDIAAKAYSVSILGMEPVDVLQELNLHLLQVLSKHDANRSSPRTFVSRVATNKIRDLIRRASAKKRGLLTTVSLDQWMEDHPSFDVPYEEPHE